MAIVTESAPVFVQDPGQHFRMHGLGWKEYLALLEAVGESRVRITYDHGEVELVTLSPEHEIYKVVWAQIIAVLTEELDRPYRAFGSTTYHREDLERGLEPDECYDFENRDRVAAKLRIHLSDDPPPDLAIEIDITHRDLDRESIYAALGVPELWRFDGQVLRVFRLSDGGAYQPCDRSPIFPEVAPADLADWARRGSRAELTQWRRQFRAWLREHPG